MCQCLWCTTINLTFKLCLVKCLTRSLMACTSPHSDEVFFSRHRWFLTQLIWLSKILQVSLRLTRECSILGCSFAEASSPASTCSRVPSQGPDTNLGRVYISARIWSGRCHLRSPDVEFLWRLTRIEIPTKTSIDFSPKDGGTISNTARCNQSKKSKVASAKPEILIS